MKIIKTQVSNLLEKFHFNAKINGSFIYTIFGKLIGMNKDIIFQFEIRFLSGWLAARALIGNELKFEFVGYCAYIFFAD